MHNNDNDFMIDVAKDTSYQNQSKEYYELYSNWRNDKNNIYGYKFVKDMREHTYVDGEGYFDAKPDSAEKKALKKCCGILSIAMIVMVVIYVLELFVVNLNFISSKMLERTDSNYVVSLSTAGQCIIVSVFHIIRYLIPCIIILLVTKIPKRIAMPTKIVPTKMMSCAVTLCFMSVVLCRTGSWLTGLFVEKWDFITYIQYDFSDNPAVNTLYFIAEYFIVAILIEVLYRGFVLQIFRQFGDYFAIIIVGFVEALTYMDLGTFGQNFCIAVLLGLFTIRTGSIITAIFMRISAGVITYAFIICRSIDSRLISSIIETSLSMVIVAGSIIAYSRLLKTGYWSFNIQDDNKGMSFKNKSVAVITTGLFTVWVVSAVLGMVCRGILYA